jgi:hypothetical protein
VSVLNQPRPARSESDLRECGDRLYCCLDDQDDNALDMNVCKSSAPPLCITSSLVTKNIISSMHPEACVQYFEMAMPLGARNCRSALTSVIACTKLKPDPIGHCARHGVSFMVGWLAALS